MEGTADYWVLLVYAAAVIVLVAGMVGVSYALGQRHLRPATIQPFESGIVSSPSIFWPIDILARP